MKITAFYRKIKGTAAIRRLRATGKTPGIIYGGANNKPPINIMLDHNLLYHTLKNETFHSSILDLDINGKIEKVLLREFQVHAYKQLILHVDFQRIQASKKIHVKVPLHFVNSDISPAVKLSSGIINHILSELDISCLPKDLPEFVEIDLSKLEIGHSIHLNDLKLPNGIHTVSQENLAIVTAIMLANKTIIENETTTDDDLKTK